MKIKFCLVARLGNPDIGAHKKSEQSKQGNPFDMQHTHWSRMRKYQSKIGPRLKAVSLAKLKVFAGNLPQIAIARHNFAQHCQWYISSVQMYFTDTHCI